MSTESQEVFISTVDKFLHEAAELHQSTKVQDHKEQ